MHFHDLASSWALSPSDRRAYLKAAERDARLEAARLAKEDKKPATRPNFR